jgi:phosphatidate cytidylyltransferase
MAWHLVAYERGRDEAATDFAITLGGIFYLGWLGSYLISLRSLPDGLWWFLLALPAVWLADSAAYMIGKPFGKHKMTPRLSPNKSWEGYFAGIIFGTALTALLAWAWQSLGPALAQPGIAPGPQVNPLNGAILGFVMSVLTTLGDLGESMIKRQVGVKDSGNILPGHGGAFDRIDSWLWAGVIAYYLIIWVFNR